MLEHIVCRTFGFVGAEEWSQTCNCVHEDGNEPIAYQSHCRIVTYWGGLRFAYSVWALIQGWLLVRGRDA